MDIIKFGIEKILYPLMEAKRGNHVRAHTKVLLASERLSLHDLN